MTIIFDLPVLEQLYEDAYDIYLSNNKQTSLCKSTSRVEVLFGGVATTSRRGVRCDLRDPLNLLCGLIVLLE